MPRYFFHSDDGRSQRDPEGTELPDTRAARVQATQLLGELLKDRAREFAEKRGWSLNITVTDAAGSIAFAVTTSSRP